MFKERLADINSSIEKLKTDKGLTQNVTVVAVSKRFPLSDITDAYTASGHTVYGENRIQEALEKTSELKSTPEIEIHFIGHLQTNKVKYLKDNFTLIHSVDSVRLAGLMQKHFEKENRIQDVLVQVNIALDENKSGAAEMEVFEICDFINSTPNLTLRGLMMMPPLVEDSEENRQYFAAMKRLFDKCREERGYNIDTLSMGMSGDYMVAVEEGSTMVRIGTALFGQRHY